MSPQAPHSRRPAQTGLPAAFLLPSATLPTAALLAAGVSTLLLRFPPDRYSFYPQCPIHAYLHLQCPGCGATRALAALLRGRLADAFHLNALLVAVVLPAATIYAAACLLQLRRSAEFRLLFQWPTLPGSPLAWTSTAIALALAFAVARNLHS
ncbi:MAG TPA: DUF2752 domain-containing protein [Granulicella sp.]|nr:DUF2752 domain-containing protein [Granulicella sp.]